MKKRSLPGITLVEVIVTVVVLAVVAAIAIPAFTRYIDSAHEKECAIHREELMEKFSTYLMYEGKNEDANAYALGNVESYVNKMYGANQFQCPSTHQAYGFNSATGQITCPVHSGGLPSLPSLFSVSKEDRTQYAQLLVQYANAFLAQDSNKIGTFQAEGATGKNFSFGEYVLKLSNVGLTGSDNNNLNKKAWMTALLSSTGDTDLMNPLANLVDGAILFGHTDSGAKDTSKVSGVYLKIRDTDKSLHGSTGNVFYYEDGGKTYLAVWGNTPGSYTNFFKVSSGTVNEAEFSKIGTITTN